MTRVLHILESFHPAGAGRQAAMLARGLPRDEFDVHVCALGLDGPLRRELARLDISTATMDRRWPCDPAAYWRLRRHLARLRPDVIHSWQFAANTYGRLAGGGNGARLVATERRVDLWKRWPEEHLDRLLLRRTDRLVTSCQAVRDFYLLRPGFWDPERLTIIPPGVDPPRPGTLPREALLAELDVPEGEEAALVAAVGEITHDKRLGDLIWAVEILGALFPNLHLLVLGDGPQARLAQRLAGALRCRERVHFLGRRDARDVWPHIEMFWHAGEQDGLPIAMLEAMAAGVPVVASDTPANREVIRPGETGLLFPLGARPGLARCTQKLLLEPARARLLGEAARRHVAENFSVAVLVERHAEMYRELEEVRSKG